VGEIYGDCDDWTAAGLEAELQTGTFFQAALGGDEPPSPETIELSPATAFDTYYSVPEYEPGALGFAAGPDDTPTSLDADWFDTRDTGCGDYQLVRVTMVLPESLVPTVIPPPTGPEIGNVLLLAGHLWGDSLYDFYTDVYRVCRGDLDRDGRVDLADLATLLAWYGRGDGGDLDLDGDTDLTDLAYFLSLQDVDGDRVPDGCDQYPGIDDRDTDGDGIPDELDGCPGGVDDVDSDGDGLPDGCETCVLSELTTRDGAAGGRAGTSVSLDRRWLVMGVPGAACVGGTDAGAAYVFRREGLEWAQRAKLTASDAGHGDEFGTAVAIDDRTLVVGAPYADHDGGDEAGAAYVFQRVSGEWVERAKLTPPGTQPGIQFGASVAIDGDRIVVGAPHNDGVYSRPGAAYVFRFDGDGWVQEAELTGSGSWGHFLGTAVAIEGNVVGALRSDTYRPGPAFIFRYEDGTWVQERYLGRGYRSVDICQGRIVGGVPYADPGGPNSGAAYVFQHDGTDWIEVAELIGVDTDQYDYLGTSAAIDGDHIAVGADRAAGYGSVYTFEYDGVSWMPTAKLKQIFPRCHDRFGQAVALSGDWLVAGLPLDDDLGYDSGSAFVYAVWGEDCNENQSPDACDIAYGVSLDLDGDGIPDECQQPLPHVASELEGSPLP
jgi:hypothetical protein